MKTCLGLVLMLAGLLLTGCDRVESGRRLRLPPGNPENGKATFVALKCTECHNVAGVDLPKPVVAPGLVVTLGGDVPRLRTVGDLLTAIIHPSQAVSAKMKQPAVGAPVTNMPNANDTMTVSQLVDLVRFLQPLYTEMAPPMDWTYTM